jgi:hypothetical protein
MRTAKVIPNFGFKIARQTLLPNNIAALKLAALGTLAALPHARLCRTPL